MRLCIVFSASLAACNPGLVVGSAPIECENNAQCPPGYRCDFQRCISVDAGTRPVVRLATIARTDQPTVTFDIFVIDQEDDSVALSATLEAGQEPVPIEIDPFEVSATKDGVTVPITWTVSDELSSGGVRGNLRLSITGRDDH